MDILNEIAEQHPECAAFVFKEYGYGSANVSAENIKLIAAKHGVAFTARLATLLDIERQFGKEYILQLGSNL
jgi:hypothetical protein